MSENSAEKLFEELKHKAANTQKRQVQVKKTGTITVAVFGSLILLTLIIAVIYSGHNKNASNAGNFATMTDTVRMAPIVQQVTTPQEQVNNVIEDTTSYPTGYYTVNADNIRKVYFHNLPNASSVRNAHFDEQDDVYVQRVENGYGYVEYTNERGQSSFGWLHMTELSLKQQPQVQPEGVQQQPQDIKGDTKVVQQQSAVDNTQTTYPYSLSITSPEERALIDYPRTTTVNWTHVQDATVYIFEVQLSGTPYDYSATQYYPMPYGSGGIFATTYTTMTFSGMGKQVHRFRVTAKNGETIIAQTPWRYISYSQ